MVSIHIENIVKIFPPKVKALDNVSLEIKDKEFIVILGPSGSGKTTLLRIIAGLEKPTKGRVVIGDKVVVDADNKIFIPPQKRNIGMVFQNWALYPHMKVFDNIAFPLQIKNVPRQEIVKKVKEVAEVLGIDHLLDRYPRQLSGGQQQRVSLARALVKEPEVLLLDEPFSNLDARVRITARTFVKRLQRKLGITTILVTHDQADAFAVGDRIAVLHNGKILQIGSPRELYDKPVNTFIAEFIGDPPITMIELPVKNNKIEYLNIEIEEYKKKRIRIGIRPDEATITTNPEKEKAVTTIQGIVETYEYLGSRQYALVKIAPETYIKVQCPPTIEIYEGKKVNIAIRKIYLFDPETKQRITTLIT